LRIDCTRDADRIGRLYHFAQQLAGMQMKTGTVTEVENLQVCDFIKEVITRIRARLQTRLILARRVLALGMREGIVCVRIVGF
jgi:hypothetical protein